MRVLNFDDTCLSSLWFTYNLQRRNANARLELLTVSVHVCVVNNRLPIVTRERLVPYILKRPSRLFGHSIDIGKVVRRERSTIVWATIHVNMIWRKNLHDSFVRLLLNHYRMILLLFLCKPQSSLLLQVLQNRSGVLVDR